MRPIDKALDELKALHEQLLSTPAPEIDPSSFVPFPPGIDPIRHALWEVDQVRRLAEPAPERNDPPAWVPRASCFGGPESLVASVELPGIDPDDIDVSFIAGEIVVSGTRAAPAGDQLQPLFVEQGFGRFERRFPTPPWCGADSISARYERGVLEIRACRPAHENQSEIRVEVAR